MSIGYKYMLHRHDVARCRKHCHLWLVTYFCP